MYMYMYICNITHAQYILYVMTYMMPYIMYNAYVYSITYYNDTMHNHSNGKAL